MYVYTNDTVTSHIDTVNTKENTYIKGHSGFILTVYILHVEAVERSSKYTIRVLMLFLMLCMLKVSKEHTHFCS